MSKEKMPDDYNSRRYLNFIKERESITSLEDYLAAVAHSSYRVVGEWRYGQTCFNYLPKRLQNDVQGSAIDPFNDDKVVPELLNYVATYWGEDTDA